jgi:hypothetical protein
MRDKFSELIAQGVASFEYTPLYDKVPTPCPLCRLYNNIWGMATDTHMAVAEDGETYITGRMVNWTEQWSQFRWAQKWGNVEFKHSGYWSLDDMLYNNGKDLLLTNLNGDVVMRVVDRPEPEEIGIPTKAVAMESGINKPLSTLTIDRNEDTLKECFKGTIDDVVENLNKNCMIKGTNWIVSEGRILGKIDGKIIELR